MQQQAAAPPAHEVSAEVAARLRSPSQQTRLAAEADDWRERFVEADRARVELCGRLGEALRRAEEGGQALEALAWCAEQRVRVTFTGDRVSVASAAGDTHGANLGEAVARATATLADRDQTVGPFNVDERDEKLVDDLVRARAPRLGPT